MPNILEMLRLTPNGDYLRSASKTRAARDPDGTVVILSTEPSTGQFSRDPDGSVILEAV